MKLDSIDIIACVVEKIPPVTKERLKRVLVLGGYWDALTEQERHEFLEHGRLYDTPTGHAVLNSIRRIAGGKLRAERSNAEN